METFTDFGSYLSRFCIFGKFHCSIHERGTIGQLITVLSPHVCSDLKHRLNDRVNGRVNYGRVDRDHLEIDEKLEVEFDTSKRVSRHS